MDQLTTELVRRANGLSTLIDAASLAEEPVTLVARFNELCEALEAVYGADWLSDNVVCPTN